MATIGSWADLSFSVSRNKIKTFDGLKWEISPTYATHSRHMLDALLEKTGNGLESISFTMLFALQLGTTPMTEIKKLRSNAIKGKTGRLIIGGAAIGSYKWVIDKLSVDFTRVDNKGNTRAAKVSVTLKSYARR